MPARRTAALNTRLQVSTSHSAISGIEFTKQSLKEKRSYGPVKAVNKSVNLKPAGGARLKLGNPMKPLIGNGTGNPYGFAKSIQLPPNSLSQQNSE